MMDKLKVKLPQKSYDINIGKDILKNTGEMVKHLTTLDYVIVITDKNVAEFYLNTLYESLIRVDITPRVYTIKPGEASKSLENYTELVENILEDKIERNCVLIALGGGVVGDLAGFVASSLLRGIQFVQIPTTLLSQVDSSVGGKTGINSKAGKNLIGAFYQPSLIITDIYLLKTLPNRELSAGMAEVIKYGLIQDKSFFEYLKIVLNDNKISDNDFIKIIKTSCAIKADIVAKDEKEQGVRALLNLGHTFGHSIEKYCNYNNTVLHGEAIAIGIIMAYKVALKINSATNDELQSVINIFKSLNLPTKLTDINIDFDRNKLFEYMYSDKKIENGELKLVIPENIGKAYTTKNININIIKSVWENS